MEYTRLTNNIILPKMMIGSFNIKSQDVINQMVKTAIIEGLTGFDTSPSYGSEEILGNALLVSGVDRHKVFISDKIDGWQMYERQGEIEVYVDISLEKLRIDYIDLLLIHWPFENYIEKTWKCMERLYKMEKVRAIGLCNLNSRTFNSFLQKDIEILPHVVQVEISPFRTAIDDVRLFKQHNIAVEAYSPLCRMIKEIRENEILMKIAKNHNKTVSQVILRWHLDRDIIPIFTSSKPKRIKENLDVFDFQLDKDEIIEIFSLNQDYKIFPESFGCPGY